MDASTWGFIGAITGTLVGASASIITTIITSNNAVHLQQETDIQERMERARSFQRETLLTIQEILNDALRLMIQAHMEHLDANGKGISWGEYYLPDDIDENYRITNRKLAILNERIADDLLRNELNELRDNITRVSFAGSYHEARALINSAHSDADTFLKHVGKILRDQY
ncbi:hypothetical protein [Aeromonas sobria]|uniref:hypothetical protein n=1 Tax=Aeromonas sobria TaxID=646 RepID=UPI003F3FD2AB